MTTAIRAAATAVLLMGAPSAFAQEGRTAPAASATSSERAFGAFLAPAAMQSGGQSAYAFAGVPEVGGGYRQGLGPVEIDARVKFNYFTLGVAVEGAVKYPALTDGPLQVAPWFGLGLVGDSGSRYIDRYNFAYFGLRLIPGASLSYRVADTASLVGELQVPIDIAFSQGGGQRYTPLAGGGGEIYIGDDLTAGAMAQFGADIIKEPLGVAQTRFAFGLRLGIGYRFF